VAVIYRDKDNTCEVVRVDGMDEVMPSAVNFTEDGIIVGGEAKRGAVIYSDSTVLSAKRVMGGEAINVGEIAILPEEISAQILQKLKQCAEEQVGEAFDEVVITHPAYFNDRQIYATKQAGLMSGFSNVHLLSEPLAAAIEYGFKQGYAQTLLVCDLGGGTLDACVLDVQKDEYGQEIFQELASVGDMNLGGDDFDAELIYWMKEQFMDETGIDLNSLEAAEYSRIMQKLRLEAEAVKKKLSGVNKAMVRINPLIIVDGVPKSLTLEITRQTFEAMIDKYIDRSRDIITEALRRSGKAASEVSKVILVGGSTLMPVVKRMVAGLVKEPYRATDPAKSVAMGAAIYNYLMHLPISNVKVGQVTRQVFGVEAVVDVVTRQTGFVPIIPLGSPVPCRFVDDKFASMSEKVNIGVYQWEEGREADRKYIGMVTLAGLKGATQIELTYVIDENNLFEVLVKDLTTGKVESTTFDRMQTAEPSKLSEERVNITFIIDTTGSMDAYIEGVKNRAIEFSEILKQAGIAFELGLIGFGDLYEGEEPSVFSFTSDVALFQERVKNIPRTLGGDIPESSLDALETGVELIEAVQEEGIRQFFILITDAPPHIPTDSGKTVACVCEMLNSHGITTFVAAQDDKHSLRAYGQITRGAKFYSLEGSFCGIIDSIAQNIVNLVRL